MHLRRAQGATLIGHGTHLAISEDVARANDHGTITGLLGSVASAASIR